MSFRIIDYLHPSSKQKQLIRRILKYVSENAATVFLYRGNIAGISIRM